MKFTFTLIMIIGMISMAEVQAQNTSDSPVEYLSGSWLRRVNTVTPLTDDMSWKDANIPVEFKRILDGNGLVQTAYEGTREVEVYYFYDSATKKLYGMNVDANGYVWQTEMSVNEDSSFDEVVGKALNDESAKETVELVKVSQNKMTFIYKVYRDNKVELTAEGVFLRIPKY